MRNRIWSELNRASLAICILFFERIDQTIKCVQSFLPSNARIYILNNNSFPASRDALERFCNRHQEVTIFDSEINLGAGPGRNYLINHTNEDWLFFLDNDISVRTSDWFDRFQSYALTDCDAEVFIPRILNVHENKYIIPASLRIDGNKVTYGTVVTGDMCNVFPGGASFVNRKLFDRLGLFDHKMFVGFTDFELCLRGILSNNPVRGRLVPDIELCHEHKRADSASDRRAAVMRYDYGSIENSFNRVAEKHGVVFSSDWRDWVNAQRQYVLNESNSRKPED